MYKYCTGFKFLVDSRHFIILFFRVKSGNFGHEVNSDSDLVCSYFDYWNKEIKLSKQ